VSSALISAALHEPDRVFVEGLIVRFLKHGSPWVKGVAAISAGHLARVHSELDIDLIEPLIRALLSDPDNCGKAQDALDDIAMFLKKSDSALPSLYGESKKVRDSKK
jgi:hypothetical protein